ncbi:histidinol-phosphatase HisJ family protein [Clostridiaceae bacterium M8S5]|nr:histidinol-phosphatase HisJ family protein [Clostridiaceae bacterium M8S5]
MYDYHVHSEHSFDSKSSMKNLIENGIKLGMKEICFTDHADFNETSINFDVLKHTEEINKHKGIYNNQIKLLQGVELGVQPHLLDKCQAFVDSADFDFVILSLHTCDKQDVYFKEFYNGKTAIEAYNRYLDEFIDCADKFDSYSVLGHIDLMKRYNEDIAKVDTSLLYERLSKLFKIAIEKGKGIELNTGGLRYWVKDINPSSNIIRLYKDLGGEIITFGSDSHTVDELGADYQYAIDVLKHVGFDYLTTFEGMKPKFVRI